MLIKTRQQGNSVTLTVPKEFDIPTGVDMEAKLTETGIFYEFVKPQKDFFDFSEELLQDIIKEGYTSDEILEEFRNRKSEFATAFKSIKADALKSSQVMTKEELEKEIGL